MDAYYSCVDDAEPDITFHFRRGVDGAEDECVGVQVAGGLIRFRTADEGERHVQAIRVAAEANHHGIRQSWHQRAEAVHAIRLNAGVPSDAHYRRRLHQEHAAHAQTQIATYMVHVEQIMAERRAMIGKPDAALVYACFKKVQERLAASQHASA